MSKDKGKRLQKTIDALMVSYREHTEIENIGEVALPTKESIVKLVEDI